MDLAYDHIVEETLSGDRATTPTQRDTSDTTTTTTYRNTAARQSLQSEFQETFQAFSNSPWGAKLGGLWGNVRKQSENYYEEARKEAEAASNEAIKGFTGLKETIVSRTRSLSTNEKDLVDQVSEKKEINEKDSTSDDDDEELQENETFIARFKSEAAKRLKEVQKAEDAADEALLRFGTNIRNFLRDAVSIAPPEESSSLSSSNQRGEDEILFESKDPSSGKRVIHTSRFEAQLHVIHTNLSSFSEDPSGSGDEWNEFKEGFDIEKKTDTISSDLAKYTDLRSSMEKLVPEKVEYKDFWTRYYFLRHVVETREERRKELLKASNTTEEVPSWDEESETEEEAITTTSSSSITPQIHEPNASSSSSIRTTTQQAPPPHPPHQTETSPKQAVTTLSPDTTSRRSHDEKSVADSDASYDLVSGATSRAPGSPKDEITSIIAGNVNASTATKVKAGSDESDEEDWE